MPLTHRMKRLLICLVPWMAMTAAAQDSPRQVQMVYTNVGPAEAWRLGDECYIAPSVLTSWHWTYNIVNTEATIQAEGRTLRVPTRVVHDRVLIPAKNMFEQLGGICRWRTGDEMDVLGQVRMVTLKDGILSIDSTLSSKPHVFSLTDPNRLVVDMRGMIMAGRVGGDLPPTVHASQFGPDSVRVVYESENVPRMSTDTGDATRHFEYRVNFPARQRPAAGHPDLVNPGDPVAQKPVVQENQGATGEAHLNILAETPRQLNLELQLSQALTASPRVQRIDPFTFEVILPGARLSKDFGKVDSPTIEEIKPLSTEEGTVLRIQTSRPTGVQFSGSGKTIDLVLSKPSATGRLQGKTIVIDAGHGGNDSGARSPDHQVNEKELTLAIATELADALASQGATVIMTRKDDVFIPLKERPAIANNNNADFFISIHINSNAVNDSRSGTTTYYHGHEEMSQLLAECVEHEIVKVSGIPGLGTASDTSRYHSGFAVLRYSRMPAILVETGYINCSLDRSKMCTPSFQNRVARAIVKGIQDYLGDAQARTTE